VKSHYKGVAAVIFFYSIERHESFDKLGMWVKEVKENVHEETMFFLVATKLDLDDARKVPKEEGEKYAKTLKAAFFQ
jgi:Ras-related protein Rab-11A